MTESSVHLAAVVACYLHGTGCRISILKINSSNDYIVKNCITVSNVILKRIGFHGDMINKERNYSPQRIFTDVSTRLTF
jgi:hypothetical protein